MLIPCEKFQLEGGKMKREKLCGIYKIVNLINNKVYVGQSKNIFERWKTHIRVSTKDLETCGPTVKKDANLPIHLAIRKYGVNNFSFIILELCDDILLDEKEKYYIRIYNSNNKDYGYNLTTGGKTNIALKGERHSQAKLSQDQVNEIIKELKTGRSQKEIAENFKVSKATIANINTGKNWTNKEFTYPIFDYSTIDRSGEKSGNAQITANMVMSIRKDFSKSEMTLQQLADKYDIRYSHARSICYGESWTNLPVYSKKTSSWN